MNVTTVYLDAQTRNLIDDFCSDHSISRSALIRLASRDFLMKMKGEHEQNRIEKNRDGKQEY